MQGVSWMTSKECITIKWAIKYAMTWAHKAWLKLLQIGTNGCMPSSLGGTVGRLVLVWAGSETKSFVIPQLQFGDF